MFALIVRRVMASGPVTLVVRLSTSSCSTINVPRVDAYLRRDGGLVGTVEMLHCTLGSHVLAHEEVAVIETDKVAIAVRSPRTGIISGVLCTVGDEVTEGQPMYVLGDETAAADEPGDAGREWMRAHQQREAEREEREEAEREAAMAAYRQRRQRHRDDQRARRHSRFRPSAPVNGARRSPTVPRHFRNATSWRACHVF